MTHVPQEIFPRSKAPWAHDPRAKAGRDLENNLLQGNAGRDQTRMLFSTGKTQKENESKTKTVE